MQKVVVRVPASTSNLGPGFDCLGVALRLYNSVTLQHAPAQAALPAIVDAAARLFFKQSRTRRFAFAGSLSGDVPQCRGLGSSVTVRLGILHGLNELAGQPLDRTQLFALCAELEGHPDNAGPGSFGGFTVIRQGDGDLPIVQRFDVSPRLCFVLLIPDYEVKTTAARKVLPTKISRLAAVQSCGNACAITAAFATRNYEQLRGAFIDQLHQPFRRRLNPLLPKTIAAAERAGALGAFLSGSGSTICAITLENPKRVARAMLRSVPAQSARVLITRADNHGVQIRHSQPTVRRRSPGPQA
jgi:homoserine kinase